MSELKNLRGRSKKEMFEKSEEVQRHGKSKFNSSGETGLEKKKKDARNHDERNKF